MPCETTADCPAHQLCHSISHTCELTCDGCTPDAPTDGPTGCWAAWLTGPRFGPVTEVVELSAGGVGNPSITADGSTLYFDRQQDIYRATRAPGSPSFDPPIRVDELASSENETGITTTGDGNVMVFGSARLGTLGLVDLWQTPRLSDGTFDKPDSGLFPTINNTANQFDPELTPDGLGLYYAPIDPNSGVQRIFHATRATIDAPFGPVDEIDVAVPGLTAYFDPGISPDERVLVFGALAMAGEADLYYATRSSPDARFGPPERLPFSAGGQDSDAELTSDGCTLYFTSTRDRPSPVLYQVSVEP